MPTKAGYYWAICEGCKHWEIVEVSFYGSVNKEAWIYLIGNDQNFLADEIKLWGPEITPPEEFFT